MIAKLLINSPHLLNLTPYEDLMNISTKFIVKAINGIAPGMSGQLNLMMIDNIGEGQKDRSSIKHYEMSKENLLIEKEGIN